jgi:rod shape-determining protein MreC
MSERRAAASSIEFAATVSLVVYIAVGSLLMVADRRLGYLQGLRAATLSLLEPIYQAADLPSRAGQTIAGYLSDRDELLRTLRDRERELIEARAAASQYESRLAALSRVDELLKNAPLPSQAPVLASVLDVDLDPQTQRFVLDRGRQDGLSDDAVLLDAKGLVGRLRELGEGSARATFLSDLSLSIPVECERTGVRAIARGSGQHNQLLVDELAMDVDLQVGDVLRTSGMGGVYPRGLAVAQISAITRPKDGRFARAQAQTYADLLRLNEVMVVPPLVFEGPPTP